MKKFWSNLLLVSLFLSVFIGGGGVLEALSEKHCFLAFSLLGFICIVLCLFLKKEFFKHP